MQIVCKKCKSFAKNANLKWHFKAYQSRLQKMQIVCKKCKSFANNAIVDSNAVKWQKNHVNW
jgi:hypothetical protein